MGNFEKLSVLVIVVIIVMILVVALYTWQDTDDATGEKKEELAKKEGSFAPVPQEDPWPDPSTLFDPEEEKEGDIDPLPPIDPSPKEKGGESGGDLTDVPPTPVIEPPVPGPDVLVKDEGPWTYTIKAGDTISQVSERELGTWRRQKEIFALNPGLDPLTIRAGDKLKMPARGRASSVKENAGSGGAASAQPTGAGKPVPGDWYVLRRGDRMSTVAKRAYGSIDRWPELWARNLSVVKDPDAVQEGTRIFIPK